MSCYENNVTVVILAGGLGTRLSSVMPELPKVLVPVAGRPFLSFLFDQLIRAGFNKVILCTGYRANHVEETFGTNYNSLKIIYSCEPEPLGTGGALSFALKQIQTEAVLIMNGDSYVDVDLRSYLDWYFNRGFRAVLILKQMQDTRRFGRVELGPGNLVKGFEVKEFKEKSPNSVDGWINTGVYLLKTSLLETIEKENPSSLEKDVLTKLAGKELYAYLTGSEFIDIGTPDSYDRANEFFSRVIR